METFAVILWMLGLIGLAFNIMIFVCCWQDHVAKGLERPVHAGDLFGVFFIVPPLTRHCFSGANDSSPGATIREADDQETLLGRMTDDQLPPLLAGMIRIVKNVGERIGKHRQGFL